MLSKRIATLYKLLQCNNSLLARYAGCTPGNISRLKSGARTPKPSSRTISLFAQGVYSYADYENMLPILADLCGAADTSRESLIPALIGWLYGTEETALPLQTVTPRSKHTRVLRRKLFGEKLDRAMILLELSNVQLATLMRVDISLISRYRSGIYSPYGNEPMAEMLCGILLDRAERNGKLQELAELCGTEGTDLSIQTLGAWLYSETLENDSVSIAQRLLKSLSDVPAGQVFPTVEPAVPSVPIQERYWGTEGLRDAVVRFLSDAAEEGGELLLYSDEPMDWMAGDPAFFSLWAALMIRCVQSGVHIKIIHNVDRVSGEMVDAIRGWFPLYISGMIEPYVFRTERNARFCHTVFLRTGGACIHSFFPVGSGNDRWYEYITDGERLELLGREYIAMLSAAKPILKIYTGISGAEYRKMCMEKAGGSTCLVPEFPVFTMPEGLLERMLCRAGEPRRDEVLDYYRKQRTMFEENLASGSVQMVLSTPTLPDHRNVNFAVDLLDLTLEYTRDEYKLHLEAVMELVKRERNFHLTILPEEPFPCIQIMMLKDAVSVLRCRKPYSAFLFISHTLTRSVSDYLELLIQRYATDRNSTLEALKNLGSSEAFGVESPAENI